jgi:hypothetical protein
MQVNFYSHFCLNFVVLCYQLIRGSDQQQNAMVCTMIADVANIAQAIGLWSENEYGACKAMADGGWYISTYPYVQGDIAEMHPCHSTQSCLVVPEAIVSQAESDSTPKSPNDTSSESADSAVSAPELRNSLSRITHAPAVGRAAKRQRGRERRKFYRAQQRLEAETCDGKPPTTFEERTAIAAAEFKLVVKGRFLILKTKIHNWMCLCPLRSFRQLQKWISGVVITEDFA